MKINQMYLESNPTNESVDTLYVSIELYMVEIINAYGDIHELVFLRLINPF